jgi:hypothetical protein
MSFLRPRLRNIKVLEPTKKPRRVPIGHQFGIGDIGNLISIVFRTYEQRQIWTPFAIWPSILVHAAPGLQGRLELGMPWPSGLTWMLRLIFSSSSPPNTSSLDSISF